MARIRPESAKFGPKSATLCGSQRFDDRRECDMSVAGAKARGDTMGVGESDRRRTIVEGSPSACSYIILGFVSLLPRVGLVHQTP